MTSPFPGLELLATAVLMLDEGLHVTYANPAAESLLAHGRKHLLAAALENGLCESQEPVRWDDGRQHRDRQHRDGQLLLGSDILHTVPMDPMVTGSGAAATQDMKNYGMSIAAISKNANTIGMTTSSAGMVTAMMNDASDGVMNGMMGSTMISMAGMGGMMGGMIQANAGTSGLATAMSTFIGSAANRSGVVVADMQALINKLSTSTGTIQ